MNLLFELASDVAKLGLFVACAYVALNAWSRRRRPQWTEPLTKRRFAVLGILTLVVSAIKVIEDVVAKESGVVDEAILWFVRDHVPAALGGLFNAVTLSGSARVLLPGTLLAAVVLLVSRRGFEALLLAVSAATAPLLVYALKSLVGRARPALWETQWYWGSSFPSGHTLSTAAFSTAAALCVARIQPRYGNLAMSLAIAWTGLVALSRLVLGVHWPSDVLAAMCLGAFIPLSISVAFDLRRCKPGTTDEAAK